MVQLREELELAIIQPIKKAELFASLGLATPAGVLLYGPPGCGKTLVAKAVASAANANFISVKGPELLNKYVGESERAVRSVFQRARTSSPCIIFFDELDSMVPKRSSEGTSSSERVVNQMLTEMDGMNSRRDVFVIAATNRPDIIDPAMLRPGRLDRLLYVPLPDESGRREILKSLTRRSPLSADIDFEQIAGKTTGFTGADLGALCREATIRAMKVYLMKLNEIEAEEVAKEKNSTDKNGSSSALLLKKTSSFGDSETTAKTTFSGAKKVIVEQIHFVQALTKVVPSVSAKQQQEYKSIAAKMTKEARMSGA
ncbi:unnamed protein product [Amoebophrya sp. A120]|nr:unnamed protein product [Amoebophrya sp. A120]|eukprot:GSA120T00019595001.1